MNCGDSLITAHYHIMKECGKNAKILFQYLKKIPVVDVIWLFHQQKWQKSKGKNR